MNALSRAEQAAAEVSRAEKADARLLRAESQIRQVEEERDYYATRLGSLGRLEREVERLEDFALYLEDLLARYGSHKVNKCSQTRRGECDCGWDEIRESLRKGELAEFSPTRKQ